MEKVLVAVSLVAFGFFAVVLIQDGALWSGVRPGTVCEALSGSQNSCAPPPAGLVSWWPGEGSGNDIAGGNHGTLQGGVTFGAGMVGQGFTFDGFGGHIAVPHDDSLNLTSFTLLAWINVPYTTGSDYQTVIAKSDNSVQGVEPRNFGLYVNPFNREFTPSVVHVSFISTAGQRQIFAVQGATPVTDGAFHHVAATFETSVGLRIFVDGIDETTAAPYPSGVGALPDLVNVPVSIGYNSISANPYGPMVGTVDEVAVFNRALLPEEIQQIHAAGSAGICNAHQATPVAIDIKPGSLPNSINLGSGGTVPVAIFSSATFDATTIDPVAVTLAGATVSFRGKGTPMASFHDVDGDTFLDLVVHVSTEALQLSDSDTEAILEGQTFNGQRIRGSDSVRIVP